MKLFHLSDLHLGKRLNEVSLLEDQEYILKQILRMADDEQPDAVLIAGDVYDKAVPSAEAVSLFDGFLSTLVGRGIRVLVISGNHDSPERLSFGARVMRTGGVFLSPVYDGSVRPVTLTDGFGEVDFYLLPFIKPAAVRRFFTEETIENHNDAVRCAVEAMRVDKTRRSVLLAHQFVTGAARSESEEISVGGADNVDASLFDAFDYVALGHIHAPQSCGRETLRYCGTPLKYSFSEARDKKSVTVVELRQKGDVSVRTLPLRPLRDMVELRGTYAELTSRAFYEGTTLTEDYTHVTLTDEEEIPEAGAKLRVIYRGFMKLDYDNRRTRAGGAFTLGDDAREKSPFELFSAFYEAQNGQPMSPAQEAYMKNLIGETTEGEA